MTKEEQEKYFSRLKILCDKVGEDYNSAWSVYHFIDLAEKCYKKSIDEFVEMCDKNAKYNSEKHPLNAYCINRLTLLHIAEQLKGKNNE